MDRVYCARVVTWEHDLGAKEFRGLRSFHKPIFAYYVLLERMTPIRSLLHPLDKGMFRRVGIGHDDD